jgi:hypothetical protein
VTKRPRHDNSTFAKKKALRLHALDLLGIEQPVVCETHGGAGKLFDACYPLVRRGVVFEKDAEKAATLAKQRPSWSVYECDATAALDACAHGGSFVRFRHPVDDPPGSPETAPRYWILNAGELRLDRTRGGQRASLTLELERM